MCSWLVLDEILPDWMRPDLSGAIVHLSVIWHGHVIMSAVPVGRAIPAPALEWLKNYAREHKRPFIYFEHNVVNGVFRGMRRFGFGPEQFRRDVIAMAEKELSSGLSMRLVQS